MEITTYHLLQALAFDSIYNVLTWYDRAIAHLFIISKTDIVTDRCYKLSAAIAINKIEAPEMKYKEDHMLYFYEKNSETWQSIEFYPLWHQKTTEIIKRINN